MKRIWAYLILIRIGNIAIIALTQYSVASFLIRNSNFPTDIVNSTELFLIIISTVLTAAAGYVVNDFYDTEIDKINKPKKVVISQTVSKKNALKYYTLLTVTGIGLGFFVSFQIGFITIGCAFLLWIYSRFLKRKNLSANLVIASLMYLTVIEIEIFYNTNHWLVHMYAFLSFIFTLIREVIKDLEDIEGDNKYNSITFPIILGIKKAKWLVQGMIIIAMSSLILFAYMIDDLIVTVYFGCLITVIIYQSVKLQLARKKSDFSFLSNISKSIILLGIISMMLIP